MDNLAAARVMFSSSATATKYLKCRSSMVFALFYRAGVFVDVAAFQTMHCPSLKASAP
jgi:hypothetical protein